MIAVIRWQALVDLLALAAAFYVVLRWARQARAVRIALAIIGLHAGALVARNYDLIITSWVLTGAGFLAIAVLLVVFQPELRHAFMRLDTVLRARGSTAAAIAPAYRALSEAAFALAGTRTGALIAITRRNTISELIQGGVALRAQVSRPLIEAIFQKTSPLHDGAAIVEGNDLVRAGAVLPLTQSPDVRPDYGTRHRAAMGLARRSDALVIAVSEERGTVTLMEDSRVREIASVEELAAALEKLEAGSRRPALSRLRRFVAADLRLKFAALGLAALVWAPTVFTTGSSVRTITVPVEFTDVPRGMSIAAQSASEVDVQLRGNSWIMGSASFGKVAASFDLRRARA
ncbi:MAG: DNA integrity scanning protein DisA nucleotide-binding domain protein, partial [Bryobacteraceae bacterium]